MGPGQFRVVLELAREIQQARDDGALVLHFPVRRHRLFVPLDGALQVAPFGHHVPEVVQHHRHFLLAAELAGDSQALFVRALCTGQVASVVFNVGDVVLP